LAFRSAKSAAFFSSLSSSVWEQRESSTGSRGVRLLQFQWLLSRMEPMVFLVVPMIFDICASVRSGQFFKSHAIASGLSCLRATGV